MSNQFVKVRAKSSNVDTSKITKSIITASIPLKEMLFSPNKDDIGRSSSYTVTISKGIPLDDTTILKKTPSSIEEISSPRPSRVKISTPLPVDIRIPPPNIGFFGYIAPTTNIEKGVTSKGIIEQSVVTKQFINVCAPNNTSVTNNSKGISSLANTRNKGNTERTVINAEGCDIIQLDENIRNMLSSRISTVESLETDLHNLLWITDNSDDPVDKVLSQRTSDIIRKRIRDIENGFELSLYILRTSSLIANYKELISQKSTKKSFITSPSVGGAPPTDDTISSGILAQKNTLINEFMRIASSYVIIGSTNGATTKLVCNACQRSNFIQDDDDDSVYKCKFCGNIVEILDDSPTFKDTDRVNMSNRYTYSCEGHMKDAINCYEGRENIDLDSRNIIGILKIEMKYHNLTKQTVTKDQIYLFLTDKKLSDFYENINLIYYKLTGIPPPNITKYRSNILVIFFKVEEAYKEIKDPNRTNSLNVYYKFMKIMQLEEIPCKKDDFYILKTPGKLGEHEEKWMEIITWLAKRYPDAKNRKGKPLWVFKPS